MGRVGVRIVSAAVAALLVAFIVQTVTFASSSRHAAVSVKAAPSLPSPEALEDGEQHFTSRTPKAPRSVRQSSGHAYRGISSAAALRLARRTTDIGKTRSALSGLRNVRPAGDFGAVATIGEKRIFVASSQPLRVSHDGKETRTSLTIESGGHAFMPQAPVVPLSIEKSLDRGVTLGKDIKISLPRTSSRATSGKSFGSAVFYGDTSLDTDTFVQAMPQGAEFLWQLRSDRSPREHALEFSLPAGERLRPSGTDRGGAEIVRGDVLQASIPAPVATDADGTTVPVSMTVKGTTLWVSLDARTTEPHYPIMVDPVINGVVRENYGDFYNPNNGLEASFPNFNQVGTTPFGFSKGSVLLVAGNSGVNGRSGYYSLQAPGSAQIFRVDLDNAFFNNPTAKPAFFYANLVTSAGAQVGGAWTFNAFNAAAAALPVTGTSSFGPVPVTLCASHPAAANDNVAPGYCSPTAGSPGNQFLIGALNLGTWASGFFATQIGGASVQFNDPARPSSATLSGIPTPTAWTNQLPTPTVSGTQGGLGVGGFRFTNAAGTNLATPIDLGCYKNNSSLGGQRGPTSTALPPCPQSTSASFTLSAASVPEGVNTVVGVAQSLTNLETNSVSTTIKYDHTGPSVTESGVLSDTRNQFITADRDYPLTVVAKDGDPTSAATQRSGTTSVRAAVTGPGVDQTLQNGELTKVCTDPNASCSLRLDATLTRQQIAALDDGTYKIQITAKDALQQPGTDSFDVKVDNTSPDVSLRGTLGDALGKATTAASSTLDYVADDPTPGSGLASLQISLDDTQVVSSTSANDASSGSYTANLAGLNAGPHTVTVRARDALGNTNLESYLFKVVNRPTGPSRTVDVGPGSRLTIVGAAAGDRSGTTVVPIGDLNQDGIDDVAVGAPGADPSLLQLDAGVVYIIYGKAGDRTINLASFSSTDGIRILGANLSDNAGAGLANAGDINGDGTDDLLVGAPRTGTFGLSQPGSVYGVLMPNGASTADINLATPGSAFKIDGPSRPLSLPGLGPTYSKPFGTVLGTEAHDSGDSTDVNDDGFADIVIGSPEETVSGPASAGEAYVIYGSANPASLSVANLGTAGRVISGANAGDALGSAVAITDGNIAVDGSSPQVVVGAPGTDANGLTDSGRVYELRQQALVTPSVSVNSLDASSGSIDGPGGGARLGGTIAPLGDINQDGQTDFALGGTTVAVVFGDAIAGNRRVADTPGYRITSSAAPGTAEKTVSSQTDVDGDNVFDLLVGQSSADSDTSWLLYGRPGGGDLDLANLPAAAGTRLSDADRGSAVLADFGDINGDGNADYAVGTPSWGDGLLGANRGRARVGQSLDRPSCEDDRPTPGATSTVYMCDELGVENLNGDFVRPASLRASAAASQGRLRFGELVPGTDRHLWRHQGAENYDVYITGVNGERIEERKGRVQYRQYLLLRNGRSTPPVTDRSIQHTQWTQSIKRVRGAQITPLLTMACRIDITGDDDRRCAPEEEDPNRCASPTRIPNNRWWRQPAVRPGPFICSEASRPFDRANDARDRGPQFLEGFPGRVSRYFYRSNMYYLPASGPNPFRTDGYFTLPPTGQISTPVHEFQTYRFTCRPGLTDNSRTVCQFNTAAQTVRG